MNRITRFCGARPINVLLLVFSFFLAAKAAAHEGKVDAAVFNEDTGTYYFFFKGTFTPKKLGEPLLGGGRLNQFGDNFPSAWESGIDAVVYNSNTENYYFFKKVGRKWMFIRKPLGRDESFTAPQSMDEFASTNDFPSQCAVHAAAYDPIAKVYYFFKRNGDFCSKAQGENPFEIASGKFEESYPNNFDLRAVALRTGTSADNSYFFFSKDDYVRKTRGNTQFSGSLSIRQNWENWPALHGEAGKVKSVKLATPEARFTNPGKAFLDKASLGIRNRLLSLIKAAENEITVEMFLLDDPALVDALVKAHERGVYVRVIYDQQKRQPNVSKRIYPEFPPGSIDELHQVSRSNKSAIMHNKAGLFSSISTKNGPLEYVILTSSANMYSGSQIKYQDALTIADEKIYRGFLEQSYNIVKNDISYIESVAGSEPGRRAYFFPRRSGTDTPEDLLQNIVDNETYAELGQLQSIDVKINMGTFSNATSRKDLRERLIKIGAMAGGSVEIMLTASKLIGDKTHEDIMEQFQGKRGVKVHLLHENAHSKYMLVKASFLDANGQTRKVKVVYAGSHNFTGPALTLNYENWIKISDPKIYNKYAANFRQILKVEGLF